MQEDYYDLIDVDMHGSDSTCIGPALDAIRHGGLLYATSTDGFSGSGKRPTRALASYGAYTRAHPFCGEQGLRMLIGAVVREGATRGLVARPVFSLYSPHGPVYRVMLRVTRSRDWPHDHYGFVGYSQDTGAACVVPFKCAPCHCLYRTGHVLRLQMHLMMFRGESQAQLQTWSLKVTVQICMPVVLDACIWLATHALTCP